MPYNSGTGAYERRSTTVIDASPDGDTVYIAIDAKLDQAADDTVTDLNHHKTNGNHYPATSTHTDSRFLKQSPAGVVAWADGVVAADAALKDFSNVASGAIAQEKLASGIAPAKIAQDASNRFMTDDERAKVAIFPGRNKIINGNFNINQRGYVSGTNTAGANQYTRDRWRVVTSGQNITFTASGNGNLATAPAGGIEQVIEGINIEGGAYVLNWTGTATAAVNGTARAKGESFSLTANTDATVKFSSGTVGLVQLEAGSVVTPFEHRNYVTELALCERYYELVTIAMQNPQPFNFSTTIRFAVDKRAVPTMLTINNGTNTGVTGKSFISTTTTSFSPRITTNVAEGVTLGWVVAASIDI